MFAHPPVFGEGAELSKWSAGTTSFLLLDIQDLYCESSDNKVLVFVFIQTPV